VGAFVARGVDRPWAHQAVAAEAAHEGRHVVMATGTASGKSLGYQLPENAIKSIGLSKARFYLTAENLLYYTAKGFTGLNPEALNTSGVYASPLVSGYQRGAYPVQQTFAIGIDINF
ncbi:MAG: hypothetical protein EOP54_19575, partial [Sphingobacteriales bacterium]